MARKKTGTRISRTFSCEPLEARELLAADIATVADFESAILRHPVAEAPGPGEMVFLAAGPHPGQIQIRETNNVNAADTTNADVLQPGGSSGLDLTGAGLTVGIWDGGHVRSTHVELSGRVTQLDSSSNSNHATHVAGTIGAVGIDPDARGMASEVAIRSWNFSNDAAEIRQDAANIDVSNHSYGRITGWRVYGDSSTAPGGFVTPSGSVDVWISDYSESPDEAVGFGRYTGSTEALDETLHDNPHLVSVWSAGNDRNDSFRDASTDDTYVTYFSSDPGGIGWTEEGWYLVGNGGATPAPGSDGNGGTGYDSLSASQVAKNSIVVGAVSDVTADPYTSSDINTTSFSSYGSTDDGRIKPDLVGNGRSLYSSTAGSDTDYGVFSGTSMSAPNVTGSSLLVIEHFNNELQYSPLAATTKSLLIHTASDAGNEGPDFAYGWGLVNAEAAANLVTEAADDSMDSAQIAEMNYGGTELTQIVTSDGTTPLKVTIAWTDLAGTPQPYSLDDPTSMLVNDLDLWISGPDGTHLPWTLDGTNPEAPAVRTSSNHVDNVEQVLVDSPVAGSYTIHVGGNLVSNDQNFSIVVSGTMAAPVGIACDFNDDGACDGTDIDQLQDNIVNGPVNTVVYDLDGDGQVTGSDRDEWLLVAGNENLASGTAYLPADANLDGSVDGSDFNRWNANKFTASSNWTDGDFNLDGVIDASDFNIWNSNKFTSSILFTDTVNSDMETSAAQEQAGVAITVAITTNAAAICLNLRSKPHPKNSRSSDRTNQEIRFEETINTNLRARVSNSATLMKRFPIGSERRTVRRSIFLKPTSVLQLLQRVPAKSGITLLYRP